MQASKYLKIIHISDFHFRAGSLEAKRLISPFATSVRASGGQASGLLVALTGDVAYSGNIDEYATATQVLHPLVNELQQIAEMPLHVAMVPGNHDCNFKQDTAVRKAVLKTMAAAAEWDSSVPPACTSIQRHFFDFADAFPESILKFSGDSLCEHATITLDSHVINIWGMNTAWMSQLHEQPGSIWFPVHLLRERIESAEAAINILLLHHPFAWFHVDVRRDLLLLVDSAVDLVLGGHEHLPASWIRDDLDGAKSLVVEGGVFQEDTNKVKASSFNIVCVPFDQSEILITSYEYDGKRYVPNETRRAGFARSVARVKPYRRLKERFHRLLRSAGTTFRHPKRSLPLELRDIYVEPELLDMESAGQSNVVEKLVSTKSVLADLPTNPCVAVGGPEKCGKSSWLKWVYLYLHGIGLTPVLIDGSALKGPDLLAVMDAVEEEYLSQYDVQDSVVWSQLEPKVKALLVDGLDSSRLNQETKRGLLIQLRTKFGVVLLTCDDAVLIQAASGDSELEGFARYQLPEFGHRLRDALISKWVGIGQSGTLSPAAFQLEREQRVRAINALIGQSYLPSRPIFLLTLLQSMEMGAEASIRGSSLGEYYEYLIRHAVLGAEVQARDLDAVINYLTEMGYFFISGDRACLNHAQLAEFDTNFSKRYALNLRFDSLHRQLTDADILEEWDDQFRFKYRYVLLFFGARYLAKHFGQDQEITRQVQALGRHLYINKYADLMLFVVHHSDDPAVLNIVLEEAETSFGDIPPLKLDQEDVGPINALVAEIPRLAVGSESTERRRERELREKDALERNVRPVAHESGRGLALASLVTDDIQETLDYAQRVSYALRLLAILGQVLRNHYGSLRADRKEEIARKGYNLVARVLRSAVNVLSGDRESLIDEIARQLEAQGAHTSERAKTLAARLIFGLGSLIVFLFVKRASEFLGSDKLLPTHELVSELMDTPLSRLLGIAVTLEYPTALSSGEPREIPFEVLSGLEAEFRNNPCAALVLRRLVLDYLHMFEISYKDKQRICDLLGISVKSQQRINLLSKRRRGGH